MDWIPAGDVAGEADEPSYNIEQERENHLLTRPSLLRNPISYSSNEIPSEIIPWDAFLSSSGTYPNHFLPSWLNGCWPVNSSQTSNVFLSFDQMPGFPSSFPQLPDLNYSITPWKLQNTLAPPSQRLQCPDWSIQNPNAMPTWNIVPQIGGVAPTDSMSLRHSQDHVMVQITGLGDIDMPDYSEPLPPHAMVQNIDMPFPPMETHIPASEVAGKVTQRSKMALRTVSVDLSTKDMKDRPAIFPSKRKRMLQPLAPKQDPNGNQLARETLYSTPVEGLEPRTKRRRYDRRDREQTALVRKIGSCIRCR